MSIKIYSVTEITALIKDILESNFYGIWVEGEVSSMRYSATGHLYFSLVDEGASLGVIVYKNRVRNIRFRLKNGLRVTVFGSLSLYAKGGEYRIVAEHIRDAGSGKRFYDLEKLKKEFKEKGYFDRKREIPLYPKNVIVITSPTGAAIQDIINILKRRGAGINVYIYPVSVQGEGAKPSIIRAFKDINEINRADLVILARGGGSNEDLWIFNDPDIAKGFFNVKFPTISAIGHETDFTLCDFVADLRAETPSSAAELITKSKIEIEETLKKYNRILKSNIQRTIINNKRKLTFFSDKRFELRVRGFINNKVLYLDNLNQKMEAQAERIIVSKRAGVQKYTNILLKNAPLNKLNSIKHKIEFFEYRISKRINIIINDNKKVIKNYDYKLGSLNPENILKRGYTITTDLEGKPIKSVKEAQKQTYLMTRFSDGTIKSLIKEKKGEKDK